MAKREQRGGKYIATGLRNDSKPASYIGSKFPELGPIPAPRDDCAPPLIVCGRCAVCERAAALQLAGYASSDPGLCNAGELRDALVMLGIIKEDAPDDKEAA